MEWGMYFFRVVRSTMRRPKVVLFGVCALWLRRREFKESSAFFVCDDLRTPCCSRGRHLIGGKKWFGVIRYAFFSDIPNPDIPFRFHSFSSFLNRHSLSPPVRSSGIMPHYNRLILYFDGASRNNPRKFFACESVFLKIIVRASAQRNSSSRFHVSVRRARRLRLGS